MERKTFAYLLPPTGGSIFARVPPVASSRSSANSFPSILTNSTHPEDIPHSITGTVTSKAKGQPIVVIASRRGCWTSDGENPTVITLTEIIGFGSSTFGHGENLPQNHFLTANSRWIPFDYIDSPQPTHVLGYLHFATGGGFVPLTAEQAYLDTDPVIVRYRDSQTCYVPSPPKYLDEYDAVVTFAVARMADEELASVVGESRRKDDPWSSGGYGAGGDGAGTSAAWGNSTAGEEGGSFSWGSWNFNKRSAGVAASWSGLTAVPISRKEADRLINRLGVMRKMLQSFLASNWKV